jgi:hypothetical protein
MARCVLNHSGGSYDGSALQDAQDVNAYAGPIIVLTGTADAINPHVTGNYIVNNSTGADAMTLGAPTAGVDDNLSISIYSNTAEAHTLTATGLLQTGQSGKTGVITFAAYAGSGVQLRAYQGKWQVLGGQSLTYTS